MLIHRFMWDDLGLDDRDRLVCASACFYLGYGVEQTRRVLDYDDYVDQCKLIDLAELNGFSVTEDLIRVARP